jgi:hypothetical protein
MTKLWENVNISPERMNGLRLRVAQIEPKTTVPRLLDHVLSQAGIELLTDKELEQRLKEMEVQV